MLGAAGRSGAHSENPKDLRIYFKPHNLSFFLLFPTPPKKKNHICVRHNPTRYRNPLTPLGISVLRFPPGAQGFSPFPRCPQGGVRAGGTSLPPTPPLFLISLGEVAISGDLGFLQLFFVVFSLFVFFSVLESPWWLRGGGLGGSMDPFWWGLGGSVQLLLLLGSSPAPHKEKFQGGIFMPRVGLDFLSDFFFFCIVQSLFWVVLGFFFIIFPPLLSLPPLLYFCF